MVSHFFYRLQKQLSDKDNDHMEAMKAVETKYLAEIQTLKELMTTSESNNTELQKEVRLNFSLFSCLYVHVHALLEITSSNWPFSDISPLFLDKITFDWTNCLFSYNQKNKYSSLTVRLTIS